MLSQRAPEDSQSKDFPALLSFLLQAYPELPSVAKSLIPFMVIQYIFSNNLTPFMKHVATICGSTDLSETTLTTSCINNALAVSTLFWGEGFAKRLAWRFRKVMELNIVADLPSGDTWRLGLKNILDGEILIEMDNDLKTKEAKTENSCDSEDEVLQNKINTYAASVTQPFLKFFSPCVQKLKTSIRDNNEFIEKLKTYALQYDFNASILAAIKKEIATKKTNTNLNVSHIYFVSINYEGSFEHAFVIEQFYLEQFQEVRYRIYQSWIKQAKLIDDFNKRGYGKMGAGALNESEINNFLDALESYYCKNNTKRSVNSTECFGYSDSGPIKPLLTFKDDTLTGMGVRYFTQQIDPYECLKNLADILNSNPELAKEIATTTRKAFTGPL